MAKNTQRGISLQCLVGPTTALVISKGKIISGCGGELSVFDLSANEFETRLNVFSGSSIHGLREGQSAADEIRLCVFGAKQACIVSFKIRENKVIDEITFKSPVLKTKDWIWNAQWVLDEDNTSCVALALAHNSAVLWDWNFHKIRKEQECTEKCILYCAHFVGSTWRDLIFFAGTVFNKIVLWPVGGDGDKNSDNSRPQQGTIDIMHTFSGHKGVIFSIEYHCELKRLCSVSDDRSIRMWQLSFPEGSNFPPSVEDWKQIDSQLLFTLYGHAARVWDVVMLSSCFVSVGEDATCLLWDYKGNITQKFKGHIGKSIWSLSASEDEKYVITGGGDASIRVWKLQQGNHPKTQSSIIPLQLLEKKDDFPRTLEMLDFNTVLIMMNSGSLYKYGVREQEFHLIFSDSNFKSYSVMCPCHKQNLCAVGNIKGAIRIFNAKEKAHIALKDASLFAGKVLSVVWVDDARLLCSGPNGECLLLKISEDEEDNSLCIKTQQKLILPACKHRWITGACFVHSEAENYLVCGNKDGSVYLYNSVKGDDSANLIGTEPLQSFHHVHGKTGVTSVCERGGSIYTTGKDGFYREWKVQEGVLVQLHGQKILKGLDWVDQLHWSKDDFQVYGFISAFFVVWSVSHNQQLISIHCGGGHRSWGFWRLDDMSRFVYLKSGEACIIDCVSHSNQALLQPALHGREICDLKFAPLSRGNASPVLCSASEDTSITVSAFMNTNGFKQWKPLVVLKGHLSSVRALAVCPCEPNMDKSSQNNYSSCLLFSGGGRAEVRAWKLRVNTKEINFSNAESDVLKPKTSQCATPSINHPACSDLEASVSDKNPHIEQDFVKKELCEHEHLCTHFLGESRHKKRFNSWKSRKLKLDPETRVMSIHASPLCDLHVLDESVRESDIQHQYILSLAGSDGYFRIFAYDESSRNFQTLATSFYHKCCVLKTFHYRHLTEQQQRFSFALSASTRGDIAIWNLSYTVSRLLTKHKEKGASGEYGKESGHEDEDDKDYVDFSDKFMTDQQAKESDSEDDLQPVLCLKAHQSGINSLHALQISESSALFASGGDDNSIVLHKLLISDSEITVLSKGTKVNAHSAQITGIWLVSPSLMVSSSIDQRVSVWQLRYQQDTIEMDMMCCKYIDIADVSCLDAYFERNTVFLCVGGEGMCLLSFDLNDLL